MRIIDHGQWIAYKPDVWPETAPPRTLFAKRESDGIDWYVFSRTKDRFADNTVKATVRWDDLYKSMVVSTATYDVTMLFPAGQLLLEITEYTGNDPLKDFASMLYANGKFTAPMPNEPGPNIEQELKMLRTRFDHLEHLLTTKGFI